MCKRSEDHNGFDVEVPLKFFNRFFSLEMAYPSKRLLSVEFRMVGDNQFIIKNDSDTNIYSVVITSMELRLQYLQLEPLIRSRFYESIQRKGIVRSFAYSRSSHFTMQKDLKHFFFSNIFSFSTFATHLVLLFQPERLYSGAFKNSFVYKSSGIKTIHVFRDGIGINQNNFMTNMKLEDCDSKDCNYLYNNFLRLCCKNGEPIISFDRWFQEMFIFAIDLSMCPMSLADSNESQLQLLSKGCLDLSIETNALSENYVLEVIACFNACCAFDASGTMISVN